MNALEKAHSYALLSRRVGVVIMLLALAWGLWIVWQQYQNRTGEFVPDE